MSTANRPLFWKTWSFLKAMDQSGIVSLTDLGTPSHYWISFPLLLSTVCQILRDTFFPLFFFLSYFHSQLTNSILVPCFSWKFLFLKTLFISIYAVLLHVKYKEKQMWPQRKIKHGKTKVTVFKTDKMNNMEEKSCKEIHLSDKTDSAPTYARWRKKGIHWFMITGKFKRWAGLKHR